MARTKDHLRSFEHNFDMARMCAKNSLLPISSAQSYLNYAQEDITKATSKIGCFTGQGMKIAVTSSQNRIDNLQNQLDQIEINKLNNAKPGMSEAAL